MKQLPLLVPCLFLVSGLIGCGGGGGGGSGVPENRVSGVLVVPASTEDTAALLDATRDIPRLLRTAGRCPDVPVGYRPLVGARITFTGSDGLDLSEAFTSDACGAFAASAPAGTIGVRATRNGFRPIETDVTSFTDDGEGGARLASTIPDGATYRIDALQVLDDGVAFVVTDSETRQAVLGLPASAFGVSLDGADIAVASVGLAASTNENASIVLVLDSSSSMGSGARIDSATGESLDRYQSAALAAHVFLDRKAPGDEVATSLFSSRVDFIDQARLDERIAPVDAEGDPVAYALSDDGFVTDAARMRLVIDAYNRRSDLYRATGDPRHPDTPAGLFIERYRFGGTTAFHDAVGDAVDRLGTRPTTRPVIVAMTDGRDNASTLDLDGAIERARQADIPVYTVGFDAPDEADGLARLATETGGSYFQADGDGIGTVYQSIQTGIVFQYVARLADVDLSQGTVLGLSFAYDGLLVERSLTLVR